jgi:uncharacterized protein
MRSSIGKYSHPIWFYFFATIIPWSFWFLAAYLSHLSSSNELREVVISLLLIIGICAPALIAFGMISSNKELFYDLKSRIANFRNVPLVYLFLTCFLMLGSILLAQLISLFMGYSADQFRFASHTSFYGGALPGWFWIFFAPLAEELGWHTYGTDCLRNRMNLLMTSLLFSVYWAFWHYPAFLIKGYYQSNLNDLGFIYSLNFMLSIIPFVLIMNWLYYKTNRNILVAIVFHITAGYFNELFNTNPNSKIIQSVLLAILAIVIVIKEKNFFLKREYRNISE